MLFIDELLLPDTALCLKTKSSVGTEVVLQVINVVIVDLLSLIDDDDSLAECIDITHVMGCKDYSCVLFLIQSGDE